MPTKHLVQAVKRNADRFPDDFAFALTAVEWDSLRSQIVTSKGRGGRRHPKQAEIDQLEAWRQAWYPALAPTQGMAMPMGPGLSPDPAIPFDQRFIDAMIPHHEGAIAMATRARTQAEHAEIKELAERIITGQQAEIDQMKEWRAKWGGTP